MWYEVKTFFLSPEFIYRLKADKVDKTKQNVQEKPAAI